MSEDAKSDAPGGGNQRVSFARIPAQHGRLAQTQLFVRAQRMAFSECWWQTVRESCARAFDRSQTGAVGHDAGMTISSRR